MDDYDIKNFDELVYEYTGRSKKILKKEITNLTGPGDNYCSVMLKVDITLKDLINGKEEILNMIAKCRRSMGDFFDRYAPMQFKREIGFYTEIIPALENLQRDHLKEVYDIFPKIYASRRNLDGKEQEIDEHAVILMENLKIQGYSNIERQKGFDIVGAKRILQDLAIFHALPIALKLLRRDIFEKTVKKYIEEDIKLDMSKIEYKTPCWITYIGKSDECKPYIGKIENQLKKKMEKVKFLDQVATEPLASITHNDLWVNNTMQKFDNGKIVNNKIIDFQLISYGNPLLDIIFFIFSSVQQEVLEENSDDLIDFYRDRVFEVLEDLKCDTNALRSNFSQEIETAAQQQLIHLLYMTVLIYGKKDEDAVDFTGNPLDMIKESAITTDARNRLIYIIKEFGKRGWI